MLCSAAGGGTGETVTITAFEELLYEAVIVTGVSAVTTDVVAPAVPINTTSESSKPITGSENVTVKLIGLVGMPPVKLSQSVTFPVICV